MSNIESRLARQERSNRRWRWLAVVATVCLLLRLVLGAAPTASFDALTVARLEVVDPQGHLVGVLSGQDGSGALLLSAGADKGRVTVGGGSPQLPLGVRLFNSAGQMAARIGVSEKGAGSVDVGSAKGNLRAVMVGDGVGGQAGFTVFDDSNDLRASLTGDDVSAAMLLATHKGKALTTMIASDVLGSHLSLKQPGEAKDYILP
jgi:hypothetical protein